jgi:hypothetical protein
VSRLRRGELPGALPLWALLAVATLTAAALPPVAALASGAIGAFEPSTSSNEPRPGSDPREERDLEYKLKAAFLYQFIRYTAWPDTALENERQPIELVIVGKDPFGKLLEATFRKKTLHGRSVVITRLAAVPQAARGHLMFSNGLSPADEDKLIRICRGKPILLLGDGAGFAARGGCGNFFLERNKVRFAINPANVKAAGLAMSSELLKLAKIVHKSEAER